MFDINKAFSNNVQFSLYRVDYSKKDPDEGNQKALDIRDYAQIIARDAQSITTVFGRKQSFKPGGPYEICVEFDVVWKINDPKELSGIDDEEIMRVILDERSPFINYGIYARISLILSELTSVSGNPPLITSNTFQKG